MKTIATKIFIAAFVMCLTSAPAVHAKGDDFNSVVKMIEEFYRVKHVGIPFLAKAGMKVATTAARIKGGTARRLAEAGSIKLAVFENQDFNGDFQKFRSFIEPGPERHLDAVDSNTFRRRRRTDLYFSQRRRRQNQRPRDHDRRTRRDSGPGNSLSKESRSPLERSGRHRQIHH